MDSVRTNQTVLGAPGFDVGPFRPDRHAGAQHEDAAENNQAEGVLAHISSPE